MAKRQNSNPRKKRSSRTSQNLKFQRQFDPNYQWDATNEINNEPSMTVPDMSLTVKELLLNHSRGIHSDVKDNQGEFFDTEIPRFDDLTDIQAYKDSLTEKFTDAQIKAKDEIAEKRRIAAEEAARKEEESSQEEQTPPTTTTPPIPDDLKE